MHQRKHKSYQSPMSLGKVVGPLLVVLVIILVLYSILSGFRKGPKVTSVVPSPSSTPVVTTPSQNIITTPQDQIKVIKAGITSELFSTYSMNLSSGWTSTHETDQVAGTDRVVITKDEYSLTVSQLSGEANRCSFPAETPPPNALTFKSYVGIPGVTRLFRRGTNDERTYTVCERKIDVYETPTTFGFITYTVPKPADPIMLNEMDAMTASLNQ